MNILPIILLTLFDAIYLTTTSKLFNNQVNIIQGSPIKMKLLPTIICYIALLLGLYHFIIYSDKTNNMKIIDKWLTILRGLMMSKTKMMTLQWLDK